MLKIQKSIVFLSSLIIAANVTGCSSSATQEVKHNEAVVASTLDKNISELWNKITTATVKAYESSATLTVHNETMDDIDTSVSLSQNNTWSNIVINPLFNGTCSEDVAYVLTEATDAATPQTFNESPFIGTVDATLTPKMYAAKDNKIAVAYLNDANEYSVYLGVAKDNILVKQFKAQTYEEDYATVTKNLKSDLAKLVSISDKESEGVFSDTSAFAWDEEHYTVYESSEITYDLMFLNKQTNDISTLMSLYPHDPTEGMQHGSLMYSFTSGRYLVNIAYPGYDLTDLNGKPSGITCTR